MEKHGAVSALNESESSESIVSEAAEGDLISREAATAMFTELYNCYTASKCATDDRESFLKLKGMAEAYQSAAERVRSLPAATAVGVSRNWLPIIDRIMRQLYSKAAQQSDFNKDEKDKWHQLENAIVAVFQPPMKQEKENER